MQEENPPSRLYRYERISVIKLILLSHTHFVPYHRAILRGCSLRRYQVIVMIAGRGHQLCEGERQGQLSLLNKGMFTANR